MNQNCIYDINGQNGSSSKTRDDELNGIIHNFRIPSSKSKKQAWQSILEKLEKQKRTKTIPIISIVLKMAASLLLLLAMSTSIWIWGYGKIDIFCPKGQHITQILPDSSQIQMNADTRISYNKVLWSINRKVFINGEALFRVKKGKRFDVVADLATTSVLGTTFDVYAREGKVKVSCIEGRVSVKNNNSDNKIILTAGLRTQTLYKKLIPPTVTIKHDEVAWISGEFYFNKTPLNEVFREIERQFNVQIIYNSSKKRVYTGYFNNKDLNDALRLVCIPMDINYIINEKTIEIKQIKSK